MFKVNLLFGYNVHISNDEIHCVIIMYISTLRMEANLLAFWNQHIEKAYCNIYTP